MIFTKQSFAAIGLLVMGVMSAGCSADAPNLAKTAGQGVAYSEYFHSYDGVKERKHLTYYKPVSVKEAKKTFPDQVKPVVHEVKASQLPFDIDEEDAYLITSKQKDGEIVHEAQVSFLGKDEYDDVENFLIISVAESKDNPLKAYQHTKDVDTVGNQIIEVPLADGLPIYQQVLTTDSAMLYTYYEENGEQIGKVATAANEFYAYYQGHIYHAGYMIDKEKNDAATQKQMLEIVRKYILDSAATE